MSHRYLVPADDVRALRRSLRIKQSELARRLGVTRRTVIRGEQRGLEIPYRHGESPRKAVGEAWHKLKAEAAAADAAALERGNRDARRRANAEAARKYRRRRRVTNPSRSRVTKAARRRARGDTSRASSSRKKSRPQIRKGDKSHKIRRKAPGGRRRGRK